MPEATYQFVIELLDSTGRMIGRTPASPDWVPAIEHAHFSGICQEKLPPETDAPPWTVAPIWHPELGMPHVRGVTVKIAGADSAAPTFDCPIALTYFKAEARRASEAHVAAGRLKSGETFHYRVLALRRDEPTGNSQDTFAPPGIEFGVEEISQALTISESSLAELNARSEALGPGEPLDETDLQVLVSQEILRQATAHALATPDIESAGILLGRLCRDVDQPWRLFLDLTAHIPARHTEAREMKVTFTPHTWAAARDALRIRRNPQEQIVGWIHSHPDWCRKCPAERRANCGISGIFFSGDDCALQRTIFQKAWQIGLLLSLRGPSVIPAIFAWRRGIIAALPFRVYAPPGRQVDAALLQTLGAAQDRHITVATTGGTEHANAH
jgi:proteasome lid subunit RPN8/RPN11